MSNLRALTPDGVSGTVVVPIVLGYLKTEPIRNLALTDDEALSLAASLVTAVQVAMKARKS